MKDLRDFLSAYENDFPDDVIKIEKPINAVYECTAIAKKFGRKKTHAFSLVIGGLGLLSIYFAPNENWLILSMLGVGVAWASILAMPYAILAGSIPMPVSRMEKFRRIFSLS